MNKLTILSSLLLFSCAALGQLKELKATSDRSQKMFDEPTAEIIDLRRYVNPFIGTGGHGHTFPGPVVPFGMVQPGPDTRYEGWDGCSGYHYSDSVIYGFSQTHLSGTGIPDYGDLLVVPQVGKLKTVGKFKDPKGYGNEFKHEAEVAIPGYYRCSLLKPNINAELTATKRCAIHRYSFFQQKGKRYILLDLGYRDKTLDAGAEIIGKNEITGFRMSQAWAANQHFYFDLQTSVPFISSKIVLNKKKNIYQVILQFPDNTEEVMLRIGVSGTDIDGAKANLRAEATHWDFDKYMREAATQWNAELSKIRFQTSDEKVLRNFYTALYHTCVHPALWSDVDGRFRDFNGNIKTTKAGNYSVFSLWDTYRAANPLYTIVQPEKTVEFIGSFYEQFLNTGRLPMWTLSNNETDCMIGYHAASVIADANAKGIDFPNKKQLLDAMIATSEANVYGRRNYAESGFISADQEPESVSKTLEYAYDDWCIATYAESLGEKEIANGYYHRSQNWKNLYNPETGFFQPRQSGLFLNNFRPNEVNHHFTEANGWQYSLAVQHQIDQLIALKGGKAAMRSFLDSLFYSSSEMSGREQADITGLIGQYAQGNEPSHHMAYLYNYVGAPAESQKLLNRIMYEEYRDAPDGLSGNEDCGQMSAWYVLSSLGFYPVCPGSPDYVIGRPMMDAATIQLHPGESAFRIKVRGNSEDAPYVQKLRWNGKPYEKLFITHEMISGGGLLEIEMGKAPSAEVAGYATDVVRAEVASAVTAPYISADSKVFANKVKVELEKLPGENGAIYYTLDGSNPAAGKSSVRYNGPINLSESVTLKARIIRNAQEKSMEMGPIVSTSFVKFTQDKKISVTPQFANQYSGGSNDVLIDQQKGGSDYRSVGWQGFEGENVVAVIELNSATSIGRVSVNALQDTKSWIFFPKSIKVEVSEDGITYKKAGTISNSSVSDKAPGTVIDQLSLDFPPQMAKFVRVTVENYGLCPSWHLGAGGKTWIFLDEISVQ